MDVFDTVVKDLSREERASLLEKLHTSRQTATEIEPLCAVLEPDGSDPVEEEYRRLPLFERFLLVLRSMFTGQSRSTILGTMLLRRIRSRIRKSAPGLLDFDADRFAEKMRMELATLLSAVVFFREYLPNTQYNRDFFAFLAGIELEPLTDRLAQETDPRRIYQEPLLTEEAEIRKEMWNRFQRILKDVPERERAKVYQDARAISSLARLSGIRLEDMIGLFDAAREGGPGFKDLGKRLYLLCEVLTNMRLAPSPDALEALFLYSRRDLLQNADFDVQAELRTFLERATQSLLEIQAFNRRVPLPDILRFLSADPSYRPKETGGGEDWFVLFKGYWEEKLEESYRQYVAGRKKAACAVKALEMLEISRLSPLRFYGAREGQPEAVARYELSLSFCLGIYEHMFLPHLDKSFKIIQMSGEFYRDDNRQQFGDSYGWLGTVSEKVDALERRLSPDGDIGKKLASVEAGTSDAGRSKRQSAARQEADTEARRIVDAMAQHLSLITKLLYGLLYGEVGGTFDTLSNLTSIGGKDNKALRRKWDECLKMTDRANALLCEIRDLEV
jgi:hypothetical protein